MARDTGVACVGDGSYGHDERGLEWAEDVLECSEGGSHAFGGEFIGRR